VTEFSRRNFLTSSGALALMASQLNVVGALAGEVTAGLSAERALMRDIYEAFQAAAETQPWTRGLANPISSRLETPIVPIEGQWPQEMAGVFYRNGPAQHERAGERYAHWFDGDGMIQSYQIGDGTVAHLGRMIETPKYKAEEMAGRFLRPAFGTAVDLQAGVRSADDINVANISVLPMHDELLALWEGGSATSMDLDTLATNGRKIWSAETNGLPFSAHCKTDPDGTIWNFGTSNFSGQLVVYHISPTGQLLNVKLHALEPNGMVHDFIVTERHLIVLVPPLRLDQPQSTFIDAFSWQGNEPSAGLVFDKETLSLQRRFELEGDFHFHFGNAWEEADGTLMFDYCASNDASFVKQNAQGLMRGSYDPAGDAPTHHYQVTVSPNGTGVRELIGENAEFPRMDPRLVGLRNRFIYSVWRHESSESPFHHGIAKVDLTRGTRQTFDYGSTIAAEEHVFIPRPGGMDDQDGWLLGTTLNMENGTTSLNVFNASHIADGPIASARLPYATPLGFHGAFKQMT